MIQLLQNFLNKTNALITKPNNQEPVKSFELPDESYRYRGRSKVEESYSNADKSSHAEKYQNNEGNFRFSEAKECYKVEETSVDQEAENSDADERDEVDSDPVNIHAVRSPELLQINAMSADLDSAGLGVVNNAEISNSSAVSADPESSGLGSIVRVDTLRGHEVAVSMGEPLQAKPLVMPLHVLRGEQQETSGKQGTGEPQVVSQKLHGTIGELIDTELPTRPRIVNDVSFQRVTELPSEKIVSVESPVMHNSSPKQNLPQVNPNVLARNGNSEVLQVSIDQPQVNLKDQPLGNADGTIAEKVVKHAPIPGDMHKSSGALSTDLTVAGGVSSKPALETKPSVVLTGESAKGVLSVSAHPSEPESVPSPHSTAKVQFAGRGDGEIRVSADSADGVLRNPVIQGNEFDHERLNTGEEVFKFKFKKDGTVNAFNNFEMNEVYQEKGNPAGSAPSWQSPKRTNSGSFAAAQQVAAASDHHSGGNASNDGNQSKGHGWDAQHSQMQQTMKGQGSSASQVQQAFSEPSAFVSLQEMMPAILQQIDRLRKMGKHNLRMKLELPGGERLTLQLRLDSDRVKVRFQTESDDVRNLLNDGWAGLANQASKRGIRLAPPEFSGESDIDSDNVEVITAEQLKQLN